MEQTSCGQVRKEGLGVITLYRIIAFVIFFCMEAPPNAWAQGVDPGNLEGVSEHNPGTTISGPIPLAFL